MKRKYPNRQEILHRLSQPGAPSIAVMSEETGVPKATLYAWIYSERRNARPNGPHQVSLNMQKREKPRSPSVKMALLAQSHDLQGAALQELCHQKGVLVEELLSWRDLALSGLEQGERGAFPTKTLESELLALKEELRRKNEALAETAALLVLQKKTLGLLGIAK